MLLCLIFLEIRLPICIELDVLRGPVVQVQYSVSLQSATLCSLELLIMRLVKVSVLISFLRTKMIIFQDINWDHQLIINMPKELSHLVLLLKKKIKDVLLLRRRRRQQKNHQQVVRVVLVIEIGSIMYKLLNSNHASFHDKDLPPLLLDLPHHRLRKNDLQKRRRVIKIMTDNRNAVVFFDKALYWCSKEVRRLCYISISFPQSVVICCSTQQ
mmetsp:Transcript_13777/g.18388  ORF Transcript_13777/g.18388 Transcript_13777/m.18388 type:complete len:213 (-) Transcript_13777:904-1542(-)